MSRRARDLKRRYGISLADYDYLHSQQDGRCAICKTPENGEKLNVDHHHLTGTTRGLLCQKCNTGLGLFQEDIPRLISAIEYLKSYPSGGYVKAA